MEESYGIAQSGVLGSVNEWCFVSVRYVGLETGGVHVKSCAIPAPEKMFWNNGMERWVG